MRASFLLAGLAALALGYWLLRQSQLPPAPAIFARPGGFLAAQKQYPRVRAALREKGGALLENLKKHGLAPDDLQILLLAFKAEGELQLYGKRKEEKRFRLLQSFAVVRSSGELGPKWQEGDKQVPEGFYRIARFNPKSNYWLSLGLDYPNAADRQRSHAEKLGGDIFIHGSIWSTGCLPVTDDKIKLLYLYAVLARNAGQEGIPVYVFPFEMNATNMESFSREYRKNPGLLAFWKSLQQGYALFQEKHEALDWQAAGDGRYVFVRMQQGMAGRQG
jgi:murein L,D-transpeptidase YafK